MIRRQHDQRFLTVVGTTRTVASVNQNRFDYAAQEVVVVHDEDRVLGMISSRVVTRAS